MPKKIRVGFNILFLIPGAVGGSETYATGLIVSLSKRDDIEVVVFGQKENKDLYGELNCKIVTLPFSAKNRIVRLIVENLVLPFYTIFYKVDVLHSLGYTSPIINFKPSVVTIFDLNWYYFPENFSIFNRKIWELCVRLSAFTANKIHTTSEYSKKSFHSVLGVKLSKIAVIYPGVPEFPANAKKVDIKHRFIFSASSFYPHKNLLRLIESFKIFNQKFPEVKLVLTGLRGPDHDAFVAKIKNHGLLDLVIILGWIDQSELKFLYQKCVFFIFPSMYEGFGFPVLEALKLGALVGSSTATSLPEVGGKAALYFDPKNTRQMSEVMLRLYSDSKVQQDLKKQAADQISKFDWSKSAEEMIKVYKKYV